MAAAGPPGPLGLANRDLVRPPAGSLTALVCQHSITPLALPCKLLIPDRGTGRGLLCRSDTATGTSSFLQWCAVGGCAGGWTASGRSGRAGPQAGLCVPSPRSKPVSAGLQDARPHWKCRGWRWSHCCGHSETRVRKPRWPVPALLRGWRARPGSFAGRNSDRPAGRVRALGQVSPPEPAQRLGVMASPFPQTRWRK